MKKINLYNGGLVFILNFSIFAILILGSVLIYILDAFIGDLMTEISFLIVNFLILLVYISGIIYLLKTSGNKKYFMYFNFLCGAVSFVLMLIDGYFIDLGVETILMCVYVLLFSFIHFFIKYSNFNKKGANIIKKSVIFWIALFSIYSLYGMSLEFNRVENRDFKISEYSKESDLKNWTKVYNINNEIINSKMFTEFGDCYKSDSYKIVCVNSEKFGEKLAELNQKKYTKEKGFNYLEKRKSLVLGSTTQKDLDEIIELEKKAFEINEVHLKYPSYYLSDLNGYQDIRNKQLYFRKLYEFLIDYYLLNNNKNKAEFYISRYIEATAGIARTTRFSQSTYLNRYIEYAKLYQEKFNERASINTELLSLKEDFKYWFIKSELADNYDLFGKNNFKIPFLYSSQEIVNRNDYYLQKIKNGTFDYYKTPVFIYNPINNHLQRYINYSDINDDYKKLDYYFELLEKLTK